MGKERREKTREEKEWLLSGMRKEIKIFRSDNGKIYNIIPLRVRIIDKPKSEGRKFQITKF